MTIAPNLLTLLTAIDSGGETAFQNPKNPLVKMLERDGLVSGNPANKNPANKDQCAYAVTAKGATLLPTPAPEADEPATEGQEGQEPATEEGAPVPAAATRRARSPNVVRDVVVKRSGIRMALPANVSASAAGDRREKYPFGKLDTPDAEGMCDSFFVEETATMLNPAKLLGSHVSKANKKYKAEGRIFKIIPVENDHEYGVAGARVMRVDKAAVK